MLDNVEMGGDIGNDNMSLNSQGIDIQNHEVVVDQLAIEDLMIVHLEDDIQRFLLKTKEMSEIIVNQKMEFAVHLTSKKLI